MLWFDGQGKADADARVSFFVRLVEAARTVDAKTKKEGTGNRLTRGTKRKVALERALAQALASFHRELSNLVDGAAARGVRSVEAAKHARLAGLLDLDSTVVPGDRKPKVYAPTRPRARAKTSASAGVDPDADGSPAIAHLAGRSKSWLAPPLEIPSIFEDDEKVTSLGKQSRSARRINATLSDDGDGRRGDNESDQWASGATRARMARRQKRRYA